MSDGHREGRLRSAAAHGVLARGASMAASVLGVSAVYRTSGEDGFAVYAVATTLSLLLPLADLGLGLGLITQVSQANAGDDLRRVRHIVSTGATAVTVAGLSLVLFAVVAWFLLPWGRLLSVGDDQLAKNAASIVLLGLALGLPTGVGNKVMMALGHARTVYRFDTAAGLVMVGANLVGTWLEAPMLYFLAVAFWVPVVVNATESIWFFGYSRPTLRPRLSQWSWTELSPLLTLGISLSITGLALTMSLQTDLLVAAHFVSATEVAAYGLAMRLSLVFLAFVNVAMVPMWPQFGAMYERRERGRIVSLLRRVRAVVTAGAVLYLFGLHVLGDVVIRAWAGPTAHVPRELLMLAGLVAVVQAFHLPTAMLINGMGVRLFQVSTTVAMGVVNVALSIWWASAIGVNGPPLATLVAYTGLLLVPMYLYAHRRLRRLPTSGAIRV